MSTGLSLYLHIGHPKAGSTTLQRFLFTNWRALRKAGVEIPTASLDVANADTPPGNPLWTLKQAYDNETLSALEGWIDAVRQHRPETTKLILSSEVLFDPSKASLFGALSRRVPIHLVYYIRRQDELLLAAWRQWGLKRGLSLSELVERRIENDQPNYEEIIDSWQNELVLASCHVRFIAKHFLNDGDLISDFCLSTGLEHLSLEPVSRQNESLDGRLLHYMSRHPEFFSSPHDNSILELLTDPDPNAPKIRAKLTPDQFRRIKDHFESGNQRLLARFQHTMKGTPVIDEMSAPVFKSGEEITIESQNDYISAQLERLEGANDPEIVRLRNIHTE